MNGNFTFHNPTRLHFGDIPPEPVTAMSHAKFAKAAKMRGDLATFADLA